MPSVDDALDIIKRGAEEILVEEELVKKLKTGTRDKSESKRDRSYNHGRTFGHGWDIF